MKRLYQAAAVLLALAAGWMILTHLQPAGGVEAARLTASHAALRAEERMAYAASEGAVDINAAGPDELDSLPGVGPAIAQRIIDERNAGGAFHYPEDLLSVRGIGEKTLNKLRDQICIH